MSNFVEWHKSSSLSKSIFCINIMIFHQTKWTIQVMQGYTVFANPRSVVGQFSFDGEGKRWGDALSGDRKLLGFVERCERS